MTLREKIIEEVKELKSEPLMQKAPAAIDLVEDIYPETLDYVSTEGRIAGLLRALKLLEECGTTIDPCELAKSFIPDEEVKEICCQILSDRRLGTTKYIPILDEIDDDIIWQYLWLKSKKLGAHQERLSEILKNNDTEI